MATPDWGQATGPRKETAIIPNRAATARTTVNSRSIPTPFPRAGLPPRRSPDRSKAGGHEDREERVRDQALPPDVQDLIDPHAGDGPGEHHEEGRQEVDAEEEPDLLGYDRDRDAANGERDEDRAAPAAEVQDGDQGASREHPEPLEREDDAEAHPAVLRRPTLDELGFGLRDVEGHALHLRDHRDREDDEADHLRAEDVPGGDRQGVAAHHERPVLLVDDRERVQRAREDDEGDHREDHGDRGGEEHGRGSQPSYERVLVVRGPPRDQDPERGEGERREDEQDPEVQVRDVEATAPGQDREDHEREEVEDRDP